MLTAMVAVMVSYYGIRLKCIRPKRIEPKPYAKQKP